MSAIYKGLAGKIAEKMKESATNTKNRFAADFAKNERLAAIMQISAETWPVINDLTNDPRRRVASLDELVNGTAVFSGRIKQNPAYGEMVAHWERAFGEWQNYALMDMEGLLPEESLPTVEFALADGTILVVRDKESVSILSKKEQDLRLSLFANSQIIPRGKMVWARGVSDDRDISEQYAIWLEKGPQTSQPGGSSMIPIQQLPQRGEKPTKIQSEYAGRSP